MTWHDWLIELQSHRKFGSLGIICRQENEVLGKFVHGEQEQDKRANRKLEYKQS